MSSLARLEQVLAGFVAGFEQSGMPGCPIGTLAAEVAGRSEDARVQAAAGFDAAVEAALAQLRTYPA